MAPVDDALDRLRQQINKSRATYVPGTPEKYPATELRGLTVLEAEALLAQAEQLREERDAYRIEGDHGHDDYEDAEDIIRQIAEKRPNQSFDPWASGLCQEFLDRPRRSRGTIATIRDRAEAAEAEVRQLRQERDARGPFFVRDIARLVGLPDEASMDEIAERVQQLREERDAWKQRHIDSERDWRKEWLAREDAEAEAQRYREGLREIAAMGLSDQTLVVKARALLSASPSDGPDDFCEHGYTTENAAHPSAGLERCPTCSPSVRGWGMSAFLHFDGMTWPDPADPRDVAWRLRYGTPSREDLLVAASVFGAYAQLVEDPQRVRNNKVTRLRALSGPDDGGRA